MRGFFKQIIPVELFLQLFITTPEKNLPVKSKEHYCKYPITLIGLMEDCLVEFNR
jgi:hypothetical protein